MKKLGAKLVRGLWGSTLSLVFDSASLPVWEAWFQTTVFSRQIDSSFPYSAPPPTPSTDYSLRTGQRLRRGKTCWGVIRCSFVSLSYKVPSAGPVMKVENTGVRTVTITWKEIPKHQRNGFINYTIFYQVEDGKGFCKWAYIRAYIRAYSLAERTLSPR